MYCPSCRDEFRPGFTHCGRCEVDLVDSLDSTAGDADKVQELTDRVAAVLPMVDYCGFFDLGEARLGRDRLRVEGVRCEIVIREQPGAALQRPALEEYWLRVERSRFRQADALLSAATASEPAGTIDCPACGATVPEQESFCPDCGIQFQG